MKVPADMWRGVAAVLLLAVPICQARAASFDLIIRNGHVIDGSGSPWYAADVAVKAGRIAAIGGLGDANATRIIDAQGLIVAPGFIDMLGQSELTLLVDPRAPSKIFQGITTEITGEGESVAPLNEAMMKENRATYERYQLKADWHTLGEYFARLEKQGIGIMPPTCVMRVTPRWRRWRKPSVSAVKRRSPSRSSISRPPARATGAACRSSSGGSRRPVPRAST